MLPSQVRAAIFTVALPSRNPSPIRPEASPMPTRDSSWCHEDQRLRPVRHKLFNITQNSLCGVVSRQRGRRACSAVSC